MIRATIKIVKDGKGRPGKKEVASIIESFVSDKAALPDYVAKLLFDCLEELKEEK